MHIANRLRDRIKEQISQLDASLRIMKRLFAHYNKLLANEDKILSKKKKVNSLLGYIKTKHCHDVCPNHYNVMIAARTFLRKSFRAVLQSLVLQSNEHKITLLAQCVLTHIWPTSTRNNLKRFFK